MVVICRARELLDQVQGAAESVLSLREAVMEVGFAETLGAFNVHTGTTLHRRVLREAYERARLDAELPHLHAAVSQHLRDGFELAIREAAGHVSDLFAFVRAAVLRASLERMLGKSVISAVGDGFIDDFMAFQDVVEDATAKAAVLPRSLSLPLVLWPAQRRRQALTQKLSSAMQEPLEADPPPPGCGPWLLAFRAARLSAAQAAELTCGLLFAAHKNPAIAVSQTVLLAHEALCASNARDTATAVAAAVHEAATVISAPSEGVGAALRGSGALRALVLETLRLTAHSLGAVRKVIDSKGVRLTLDSRVFWVAPGETIGIAHIPQHLSASEWGADARAFRPERKEWVASSTSKAAAERKSPGTSPPLNSSAESDFWSAPVSKHKFTTFSDGVHACPGERFAVALSMSATAFLLGGPYTVEPVLPIAPISFERATLAQRAAPVPIRVSRRRVPAA